jgi:crossover junction endodeoxyribonuclease RuvC
VIIFGIDPGSDRTGYGCVNTDGSRHTLITCGAIKTKASATFPEKLLVIHSRLGTLLSECRPDAVAIENLFHAVNARSALKLGHARGVAMLAAAEAGVPIFEYTPAEVKRVVVGYGRAEKPQVQHMIKMLLGLAEAPSPYDAADALAVAVCHIHSQPPRVVRAIAQATASATSLRASPSTSLRPGRRKVATSWRHYRP